MFKILGTDDAVNTCECCGKTNLKATVVVEVDGEIKHYGSVCATRHTGMNSATIRGELAQRKREVDVQVAERVALAKREYVASAEYIAEQAAFRRAHAARLIGVEFRNAVVNERVACDDKRNEIAAKYNVAPNKLD